MSEDRKDVTPSKSSVEPGVSRRRFIQSSAVAGMAASISTRAKAQGAANDEITVGILGCGAQGQTLMQSALPIPGIKFVAVCDIWASMNLRRVSKTLGYKGHPVNTYEDYREMLDKEPDMDAVLIATPDFWHAPHTVACLDAGKAVYCEKMMANTIEGARSMVEAAKDPNRILQIGHQRRSNPRYRNLLENLVRQDALGRITHASAQWNRSKSSSEIKPVKQKYEIDAAKLATYGFDNMKEFLNWRWFRKYSGGIISDLGAHQIDIFNWFLDAVPSSVVASGGTDYYEGNEHYDNIMAIYEYSTAKGHKRMLGQVHMWDNA
ncbi:MAG: Gfo/Idh/MocA family oxidoreductase, partial [Verrucomicrobiota bacterium]